MRITDSGSFDDKFFQLFSRRPGEISLKLKTGETVTGNAWTLFAEHLTLDGMGTDDTRVSEVGYSQIEGYTADVDLGRPFGQHLTEPNEETGWSHWAQRNDTESFIGYLLGGMEIKFSMVDPSCDSFVNGKIFTVGSDGLITLASGAIRVDRRRIAWVCHKLP